MVIPKKVSHSECKERERGLDNCLLTQGITVSLISMQFIFPEQGRKIAVLLTLEGKGSARAQQVASVPAKWAEFLSRAPELTCEPKCMVHMYGPKCMESHDQESS